MDESSDYIELWDEFWDNVDYILFEIDQEGKSSRKPLFGSSVVYGDWGFKTLGNTTSGSAVQFLAPFVWNLSIRFWILQTLRSAKKEWQPLIEK